jgi:signal transduction histidine kinase
MRKTGFEQLLLNILLNAAQQINLSQPLRLEGNGDIVVDFSVKAEESKIMEAIIDVYDNGPGIHRKDFERVFNIHFTTKPDGCGMGLDICRQIVSGVTVGQSRGRVFVKRSVLLGGTVFEIALPVIKRCRHEK